MPWYYLLSLIMILWSLLKILFLSMISIGFSVSLVSYIKSPIVFVTVMLWSFYLKFSSLSSSPYYYKCCLVFNNHLFFCLIIALPRSDLPDFCFFGIYKKLKFFYIINLNIEYEWCIKWNNIINISIIDSLA